jgi:hypothetical protein
MHMPCAVIFIYVRRMSTLERTRSASRFIANAITKKKTEAEEKARADRWARNYAWRIRNAPSGLIGSFATAGAEAQAEAQAEAEAEAAGVAEAAVAALEAAAASTILDMMAAAMVAASDAAAGAADAVHSDVSRGGAGYPPTNNP